MPKVSAVTKSVAKPGRCADLSLVADQMLAPTKAGESPTEPR